MFPSLVQCTESEEGNKSRGPPSSPPDVCETACHLAQGPPLPISVRISVLPNRAKPNLFNVF